MIAPSIAMNAQVTGNGTLMTLSIGGGIREDIVARRLQPIVLEFRLHAATQLPPKGATPNSDSEVRIAVNA